MIADFSKIFPVEPSREHAIAFGVGVGFGAVGVGLANKEQTRTQLHNLYEELHLHNMLKICGTVWLVTATVSWCRYCVQDMISN